MDDATAFWTAYQPGLRIGTEERGTPLFYAAVDRERYEREPHILEMARFDAWAGKDVLDVGCGIATDGARFARAGAFYTGVDRSRTALDLARHRLELEGLDGTIVEASATDLPFPDQSFDLVWSNGVIHHLSERRRAVDEFRRVLRVGGTAIVMVYHRHSLNYVVTIMLVRRLLAALLLLPRGPAFVARATGESAELLEGHRELLRRHGLRYLANKQLFLSNNTDGPGNPLSVAYTRAEAKRLFGGWSSVETSVRYLNARLYPGGRRFERSALGDRLAQRVGWHLYVTASK